MYGAHPRRHCPSLRKEEGAELAARHREIQKILQFPEDLMQEDGSMGLRGGGRREADQDNAASAGQVSTLTSSHRPHAYVALCKIRTVLRVCAMSAPSTVAGGSRKLPLHTCRVLVAYSGHVTAVRANHSGHVTRRPASDSRHLEILNGQGRRGAGL